MNKKYNVHQVYSWIYIIHQNIQILLYIYIINVLHLNIYSNINSNLSIAILFIFLIKDKIILLYIILTHFKLHYLKSTPPINCQFF